jgi:hypothetical protein
MEVIFHSFCECIGIRALNRRCLMGLIDCTDTDVTGIDLTIELCIGLYDCECNNGDGSDSDFGLVSVNDDCDCDAVTGMMECGTKDKSIDPPTLNR